jgi:hypothetical protein
MWTLVIYTLACFPQWCWHYYDSLDYANAIPLLEHGRLLQMV